MKILERERKGWGGGGERKREDKKLVYIKAVLKNVYIYLRFPVNIN